MTTDRPRRRRGTAILPVLAALGLLGAGCTHVTPYRQPVVRTIDRAAEVAFAPGSAVLTPDAAARLRRFLAETGAGPGGAADARVFVVGAASLTGDPAAVARLIDRRNEAVAGLLAAAGIAAAETPAEIEGQPLAPDTVRVTVRGAAVVLPDCPDWSAWPNYSNFHNQPLSNWSCATAVNLGMMVASPADLERGRVPGTADGTVMARSIENYRKGKTKPLMTDVSTAETFAGGGNN
jgi:pilus assembly protein CpaD